MVLMQAPGFGPVKQRDLIERHLKGRTVGEGVPVGLQDAISSLFESSGIRSARERAHRELVYCSERGICIMSLWNEDYPPQLRECRDAPPILFATSVPDWANRPLISIVGTRGITHYGRRLCAEIVEALSPYAPIVVSGFAYGVDIEAQLRALDSGLDTLAVFAHGLSFTYPPAHRAYRDKVSAQGALLTEFFSDERPRRMQFVRRNRIIAGLSEATVVVESGLEGGSLTTARLAFDYDRLVIAIPGRISDRQSRGCHRLLAEQIAVPLCSIQDLPALLGWDTRYPLTIEVSEPRKKPDVERSFPGDEEGRNRALKVLSLLEQEGMAAPGFIAASLSISIQELAPVLLRLEMGRLIRKNGGFGYERV